MTIPAKLRQTIQWILAISLLAATAAFTTPVKAQAEGETTYTVVEGDTLFEIALRYGATVDDLLEMNPGIEDRHRIYVDQVLVVPEDPSALIPDTGMTPEVPAGMQTYVVKEGDTLFEIGLRFGATVDELLELNPHVWDRHLIVVDQTLVVPEDPSALIPDTGMTPEVPAGMQTYVVKEGDTLFEIGLRFGATVDELLELNPQVWDRHLIFVDQTLVVP